MNRRDFLSVSFVGISIGISGCPNNRENNTSTENRDKPDTDTEDTVDAELRFAGVYANEVDREFIDYEYILLVNDSKDSLDVSGYNIEYQFGYMFEIKDLILEPGAQLVIHSRAGEDTTLASSPPVYLHHAGFGTELDTSVLDESGTVRVRNSQGTVISSVDYENFGCDSGTVTTESGDEVDCIHGSS